MIAMLLAIQVLTPAAIDGRIVSAVDGTGIGGATIAIDSLALSLSSNEDGRFSIRTIAAGRWQLRIRAAGYTERSVTIEVAGGATARIDVELTPDARTRSLRGRVRGSGDDDLVAFARVSILESRHVTETDRNGAFRLGEVPIGPLTLRIERAGYRAGQWRIDVGEDSGMLDLRLEPDPLRLERVLVPGERAPSFTAREVPGAQIVDAAKLGRVPVVGEMDVFRAAQALPSVTPSSDFSSALFVRGGTPDQTRILLDGAPLLNPFHAGGFMSAVNPDAMAAAILQPGALPASMPSSLSGTLEIHTRAGGTDSVRIAGGLGLLSGSTTVDGPLPDGKGTWLIAARRNWIDAASGLARRIGLAQRSIGYRFADLLGRIELRPADRAVVMATALLNRERFHNDLTVPDAEDARANWGSDVLSLRARYALTGNTLAEVGLSSSGFGAQFFLAEDDSRFEGAEPPDTSRANGALRTFAMHATLGRRFTDHHLQIGLRRERTTLEHDIDGGEQLDEVTPSLAVRGHFGTTALWIRDRFQPARAFEVDAGVRLERPAGADWHVLPRVRVQRAFGDATSLAIAGGRYVQDRWSLRNEESALSTIFAYDVLVNVPDDRSPPTGWDVVLEAGTRVAGWHVRTDAFHKRFRDIPIARPLLEPLEGPVLIEPDSIETGSGEVHGIELSAIGTLRGADVSVSWRFQREKRTLAGRTFTPRNSRTHRAVLDAALPWNERQIAVALTWMSGQAYTPVQAIAPRIDWIRTDGRPGGANPIAGGTLLFDAPNSGRLPSYLRLDVDVRGDWDVTVLGRRGRITPWLSVLNLFNAHNPLVVEHSVGGVASLSTYSQFPVLPSFGLRWRF